MAKGQYKQGREISEMTYQEAKDSGLGVLLIYAELGMLSEGEQADLMAYLLNFTPEGIRQECIEKVFSPIFRKVWNSILKSRKRQNDLILAYKKESFELKQKLDKKDQAMECIKESCEGYSKEYEPQIWDSDEEIGYIDGKRALAEDLLEYVEIYNQA